MKQMKFYTEVGINGNGGFGISGPENVMVFTPIVKYNMQHNEDGLVTPEQRPIDTKRTQMFSETIAGRRQVGGRLTKDGAEIREISLPIIPFVNCTNADLIKHCKDGKTAIVSIPETPQELRRYAKDFHIFDAQHRLLNFDDAYIMIENLKCYNMPIFMYFNISERETTALFDSLNFDAKKPSASKMYADYHRRVGILSESEDVMFDVCDVLNSTKSLLFDSIDMGVKKKRASVQAICTYSCCQKGSKKGEGDIERSEYNLVQSLAKLGITEVEDIANALNTYMTAFNNTLMKLYGYKGNAFEDMRGSRIASALSFASVAADILAKKEMTWVEENLEGILNILMKSIAKTSFIEWEEFNNGKSTSIGRILRYSRELEERCNKLSAKKIQQRGAMVSRIARKEMA